MAGPAYEEFFDPSCVVHLAGVELRGVPDIRNYFAKSRYVLRSQKTTIHDRICDGRVVVARVSHQVTLALTGTFPNNPEVVGGRGLIADSIGPPFRGSTVASWSSGASAVRFGPFDGRARFRKRRDRKPCRVACDRRLALRSQPRELLGKRSRRFDEDSRRRSCRTCSERDTESENDGSCHLRSGHRRGDHSHETSSRDGR